MTGDRLAALRKATAKAAPVADPTGKRPGGSRNDETIKHASKDATEDAGNYVDKDGSVPVTIKISRQLKTEIRVNGAKASVDGVRVTYQATVIAAVERYLADELRPSPTARDPKKASTSVLLPVRLWQALHLRAAQQETTLQAILEGLLIAVANHKEQP